MGSLAKFAAIPPAASENRFVPRAFVQHPHPLPHGQPDARPVLAGSLEDAARFFEAVAGVEHELDPQPVAAPLLDLVEVAAVGIGRVVGFRRTSRSSRTRLRQLGDVGRNASRLVTRQQVGGRARAGLLFEMDTGWTPTDPRKAKCLKSLARPTGIQPVFPP